MGQDFSVRGREKGGGCSSWVTEKREEGGRVVRDEG